MIVTDTPMLIGAAACLLSAGTLGAVFTLHRSVRCWRGRYLALVADVDSLRGELQRVAALTARAGREGRKVRHACTDVAERGAQPRPRGTSGPIDEAAIFLQRGRDDARFAPLVALSRGEAELVTRMHGARRG